MIGMRAGFLGRRSAASPALVTASAFVADLDSGTDANSYNCVISGINPGEVVLVFIFSEISSGVSSRFFSSVTSSSGSIAAISANTGNGTSTPFGVYAITGASSSATVTATFNGSMAGCYIGHIILTGTAQATYHSRSGASPTNNGTASAVTSTAITIPAGGLGFCVLKDLGGSSIAWTANAGTPAELLEVQLTNIGVRPSIASNDNSSATTFTATSGTSSKFTIAFSWGP